MSRALVFAIGYFFVRAVIDLKPSKAVSVDGALRRVGEQPDGSWLLAVDARLILLRSILRRGAVQRL